MNASNREHAIEGRKRDLKFLAAQKVLSRDVDFCDDASMPAVTFLSGFCYNNLRVLWKL